MRSESYMVDPPDGRQGAQPPAPGSVIYMLVRHDSTCPAASSGRGADCTCDAAPELVDAETFVRVTGTTAARERQRGAR